MVINWKKVAIIALIVLLLALGIWMILKIYKSSGDNPSGDPGDKPPFPKPSDDVHAFLRVYFAALYPRNINSIVDGGVSIENLSKSELMDLYQSLICFYNPCIVNNNNKPVSDVIPATFGYNVDNSLEQKDIDNYVKQLDLIFGGKLRQYGANWSLDPKTKKSITDSNKNGVMPTVDCSVYNPSGVTVMIDNTIDKCIRYLPFGIKNTYPACISGGYRKGFPYRWSGLLPIVTPMWIASYTKMGGFPDFSMFEGYTAPGEAGVPVECQGGKLGRLHVDMTENLLYGGDPLKLPVVFNNKERPSIDGNFWWDFGFDPTTNTSLSQSVTKTGSDKNAPRNVCLPFSECSNGKCQPKISDNEYLNVSWYCNDVKQENSPFSPSNYTDPVTGTPVDDHSCCDAKSCSGGNNYFNFPCTQVTISDSDTRASPFYNMFTDEKTYGYPNIGDSIKSSMNYKGFAIKSGDMYENFENFEQYTTTPQKQSFEWGVYPSISMKLEAEQFSSGGTYIMENLRWYWPVKGYGIWTYLGTTHCVATKYGFLIEGSSSDPRPMTRKMMNLSSKQAPIGGGMSIDYICTSPNSDKFSYYNMDTPFQIGDDTSSFPIPSPTSPDDMKDVSKYTKDSILNNSLSTWIGTRTFYGGGTDVSYSAVYILAKQVNDLYGAVGVESNFPGYPKYGTKMTFAQCKQMVALFNITGMIPKDGLKGCNVENLSLMSKEVWMKQFNDGTVNPNYDINLANNFICVTEWMYQGQMLGCLYGFSISDIIPVWKDNRFYWSGGTESWPVGAYFMNDQTDGQCATLLTDIAGDRQYNSLQLSCSLQGGMNVKCFLTNPYSPEVLKIICNRYMDGPDGNPACYYPSPDTAPAAGKFFSKYYTDGNAPSTQNTSPIVRIADDNGEYITKGVGRFTDQEGNVNFMRTTDMNDMPFSNDVCGSSYLLDPFEDKNNYIYNGFVDARVLNANRAIGKGSGIKLFDNRIMRLSAYSAAQNLAAYGQPNTTTNLSGTWQIVENLPSSALGWKSFNDKSYNTKVKSSVNFYDALSNMLDNTKSVFFFGGNEFNLLPTIDKYSKYCCVKPPQGVNTDKVNKEIGKDTFGYTTQGDVDSSGKRMCTEQQFCNNRICSDDECIDKSMKLLDSIVNALKRGVEIIGYWRLEYSGDQSYTSWVDVHYLGQQSYTSKGPYYPKQDMGTIGTLNYIYDLTSTFIVEKTGKTAWEYWKVIPMVDTVRSLGWLSSMYTHSKVYVCDPSSDKNATYIGSQNFTYTIGKETGIAIYNSKAVAQSAARSVGFIRYLMWHSQGNPSWDDIWGNQIFKTNKQITWDIVSPYFFVNILPQSSQKKVVKLYGNSPSNGLQNLNGDIILDSNQQSVKAFPDRCFNLSAYLEKFPDINKTDEFLNAFFNRDLSSNKSPFNHNNWTSTDFEQLDSGTVDSIISACNGSGYIQSGSTSVPNPDGLNVWWNLPKVDDIQTFATIEMDMKNSGWGNNNTIYKKGPEWIGDKSTVERPIESSVDNPIYAYLTKQKANTFWSNAVPDNNFYPEYNKIHISASMLGCIQGRGTNKEGLDHFLLSTDKYMYMETMDLFNFVSSGAQTTIPDKYTHYGIISAANRGANIKLVITNFGNICGACSIPNKVQNNSPNVNPNFIQQLWVALYGNACSQSNTAGGNISVRSFNFSAQPILGKKCRLPDVCKALPCNYTPTPDEEENLWFNGSDKCANDPPIASKEYPTSSGYGLDHGRLALNEKSLFLLNNNYMSSEFVQMLGCGITIMHPSVVQEFKVLADRDYHSMYSFDVVNTLSYPGLNFSNLTELDQIKENNPGPGWFCWGKNNNTRPCSANDNINPSWASDYVGQYGDAPCSSPTEKNKYWPGTSSTCFSHPSCGTVENRLSKLQYNFPDSNNNLPYFSSTNSQFSSTFKQDIKGRLLDRDLVRRTK